LASDLNYRLSAYDLCKFNGASIPGDQFEGSHLLGQPERFHQEDKPMPRVWYWLSINALSQHACHRLIQFKNSILFSLAKVITISISRELESIHPVDKDRFDHFD
jgi:hypothetical protein